MENENLEIQTPKNEGEQQPKNESEEQAAKQIVEEFDKIKIYGENQKIRAEKAERRLKELEAKKNEPEAKKSNDLNYERELAEETYLEQKGFSLKEQKEFLQKECQQTDKTLKEVLKYKYVQEELRNIKDQIEAEKGMPAGGGKPASSNKNSIDHWIDKKNKDGSYALSGDLEFDGKLIDERINREKKNQMFDKEFFPE